MKTSSFTNKVDYFAGLRLNAGPGANFDRAYLPDSEQQAYAIQKSVMDILGKKVLGWKLGGTNPKTQTNFNCKSGYLGPIFSVSDDIPAYLDAQAPRGEAELTFRINDKIDALDSQRIEADPLYYFDAVYPSLEMPWSRIDDFKAVGMLPLVADLCGTGHLAIGQGCSLEQFTEQLNKQGKIAVQIKQQQNSLAQGCSDNLIGGYQTALTDFLKLVLAYHIVVEPGQLVATGGITDCISLPLNQAVDISFTGLGSLTVCYP
ncbi:MAG: 2-keto-4-pentenoate hydratase [Phenylobacterium sp.]|jgi:2-keto-4-pentenoate hydratase